jgi:hypothetical protein
MKRLLFFILCMTMTGMGCEDEMLVRLECSPGELRDCDENGEVVNPDLSSLVRNGTCSYGKQHCSFDGWGECIGAQGPEAEVCDGQDNDCNGRVDDEFPEKNQLCGMEEDVNYGVGICTPGIWVCEEGYLRCEGHIGPVGEVCDSVDNDCNGVVDDQLPNATMEVCYDAPQETILVGECKPGIRYCVDGSMASECVGQVLPATELCDGKDNDCDGETDEGFDTANVDVVFVIDVSGSFRDEIDRTIYGIAPLLEDDITRNFRFGLVVIGHLREQETPYLTGTMRVITDLVPREDFLEHINEAKRIAEGGTSGQEPSWDSIVWVARNDFGFTFREDANKVIILMTDETGQSFDSPRVNEQETAQIVMSSPFIVHVYNERAFLTSFDSITRVPTNFHALEDHPTTEAVFQSLRRIFLNICTGEEQASPP